MQDTDALDAQLREKVWGFAQRVIVGLVVFLAGLLLGFVQPLAVAPIFRPLGIQGPADELQGQVDHYKERNRMLTKERDTLRSQMAIVDRDKKDVERQLEETQAKIAALSAAAEAQ